MKRAIIDDAMQLIESRGGLFVWMKDNIWSIIPAKACRLKIAHAIQYHIRNELSRGMNEPESSTITDDTIHSIPGTEDPLRAARGNARRP